MEIWTIIGNLAFIAFGTFWIKAIGKTYPILETIILIAGLQWIFVPTIEYLYPAGHYKYYMYVPENVYMGIVVPLYLVFALGLLYNKDKYQIDKSLITQWATNNGNLGKTMIVISIISSLIIGIVPPSLAFVLFLLSLLRISGILILLFADFKKNIYWIILPIVFTLTQGITHGMFHGIILDSLFIGLGFFLRFTPSKKQIILILAAGSVFIISLQKIKQEFRSEIWGNFKGSEVSLFSKLFIGQFSSSSYEKYSQDEEEDYTIVRFNQGWIISKIIKYFENEDWLNGETIQRSFDQFVPRFLNPDKKTMKSGPVFSKLTGIQLKENTAMGPSILGEFYGNYGFYGAFIALLIWGYIIRKFFHFILSLQFKYPVIIFFLPLLFYQVVKAETMFMKVSNHLFKATILMFILYMISKYFFQLRVETDES